MAWGTFMAETKRRPKIDIPFTSDAEVEEMVEQFERCVWPYERWTHRCHLAVAFSYLDRLPYAEAVERVRHRIDRYNRTCGDPNGYHETITLLFMRRVASYRKGSDRVELASAVEELVRICSMDWPLSYYSKDRLWSDEAKREWVEPDLRELDF
jgi:hypothetical protein